jgi:hypothetical protein
MRSLAANVTALGIAQIVSWGTLFYTITVLGAALRDAIGVSETLLYASFTAGLFVSGLLAPAVGRMIDRGGGRSVLALGSLVAALACLTLAFANGAIMLFLGWLIAGAAMAATLYDPAFAMLHHLAGTSYRRAVTALTLFGGFASTVFWPLSQLLLETFGVRAAYLAYAALHLALCLPLHLSLPRHEAAQTRERERSATAPAPAVGPMFLWLAIALSIASFAASALSAHLVGMLAATGLGVREAVLIGALIGPMQVAGRVMEFGLVRHVRPVAMGTIAFVVLAAALLLLTQLRGAWWAAVLFAALYGWSNGVLTIVRGVVPAELFGRDGYGALLGRLAQPQFIARAVAPFALAALVALDASRTVALAALALGGVLGVLAYRRAIRSPR